MRAGFLSIVSLIVLLTLFCTGLNPPPAAATAATPPPCCAHDEGEPDAAPACPTGECPHCAFLSVELADVLTGSIILDVRPHRFLYAGKYPPETFLHPLEYPPQA